MNPVAKLWSRFYNRLPDSISRSVRVLAVLSLVFQVVLIGTGGAVRLTASGLGCPTWPTCTDDSFVNTPEMGIHGLIEFGNRMLTGVLSIIVIAVFFAVLRMRRRRRDLFVLTLLQGLSIPFQAVVGGITVLTGLNPYVVGVHFVISTALVVLTTMLVWRVYRGRRGERIVPLWYLIVTHVTTLAVAVTVVFGILTTGAGPHAGDNSDPEKLAPRNGLDPALLQHVHSWPAYTTFALTIVLVIGALALRLPRRWSLLLLLVEIVQITVGITQARTGLPAELVVVHMILAGTLIAAMTSVALSARAWRRPEVVPR